MNGRTPGKSRDEDTAARDLRDDVASYRANGTIVTDETLRGWERRLTKLAFPEQDAARVRDHEGLEARVMPRPSAATTEPTREEKLEAALRDILEGVGAFTPGGWLASTDEIVRARALLEGAANELRPGETRIVCGCGESITTTNPYEADAWADRHECEVTRAQAGGQPDV